MTPAWNQRPGREPPRPRWGLTDQRIKLPKCPNAAPRLPLPSYLHRSRPRRPPPDFGPPESPVYHWEEAVVPRANGYHARHAESSPVRPRIVTVVRPCGQESMRKISLLLNRRAVQTFEQLMADVSEALGFPCWNNARIRRLFSPAGREIHSLADFFRFDHAFLAFGNSRPTLDEVHAALDELYPENPSHCEHLLRVWERILRPKATKADSGFHDDDAGAMISIPTVHDQQVNQPVVNNLQPVGRQKDKVRREKQRELWRRRGDLQKEDDKEIKKEEGKREAIYCRSYRGCGPPIPPIRSSQCSQPDRPSNHSNKSTSSQNNMEKTQQRSLKADRHVANTKSRPAVPQNRDKDLNLETITEQDIIKQETVEQKDLQSHILADGAKVSLEDIERCYDMGRVVGDGNFAVVRECCVRGLAETFAMKIVDNTKLQGRGHMIQNEIALLRSLEHPRLIQLFRSHHTDTHVYLLMELVTGGDLFDAITQNGRFTEPSAACMIRDISQALEYIHSKSIAHRDIKPENLLVQRDGNGCLNLKLADFGLAMVVTEPVFTVCGTPTYVAPEILAETGYGVGVDVWAMGVILFVLLSGFPPFRSPDRNQEELFRLIQKGEVHFLSPYWDNASEGAKALVRGLLEVNPKRRLTASQTLQHDWLQHATAPKEHKGAIKATDSTAERRNQQKLSRQVESGENKSDSSKPESLAEKCHAAQIYENLLNNNNYEPDINMYERDQQIQEIDNMTSNQQNACHAEDTTTTNKQYTTDQHKPEKPAQQEDIDTKQE
ncbi:serine/threonine-protein kinase DCLK3-like isoform X2 [Carassius auratus]|uniref:non-specific serine/threonine protein kinase n=1 Tax=Carassius auratus TaxID=7957 RepID=A0A6P6RGC3_CARAU|nr:serine/threonine-protein kinase DCLK3-like isoform X2 [Carassius auratus]XP_026144445.1 serine/threonine-protein kinase DCLK3-like isoform X2 [Carassius auratus]XP_026144446.1 serine/threonine-protein kinase DCLK3-like isoform X2 [Carassius auratus]